MVFVFCCDRNRVVSCLAEMWSFEDNTGITFLISQQKHIGTPQNHFGKMVLMRSHNMF